MNIPLYARMNEFAPAAAANNAGEEGHDGQDEETQEDMSPHGTLFEQCTPARGMQNAKASGSDFSGGGAAQHAVLTADVPDLKIGSALAEGNLTDGYRLHDVGLFDSGKSDKNPLAGGATEVAARDFEQSAFAKSNIVPQLELDFSSDATTAVTAQTAAAELSGGRQVAA